MTSLGDEIYLLREKEGVDEVEVYDVVSYRLLCCLTVPKVRSFTDMTSCKHFLCLYIADPDVECIHRVDLGVQGNSTKWPVKDRPCGLSVNAAHNLMVTCDRVRKIKEFSPHGNLLREVTLPDDVINPWHAIQLTNGQFVVCHGGPGDQVNRVCMVSEDGGHIINSHGGQPGSNIGQYNGPIHLAVDDDEFVFVVNFYNRQVTLLSPTLDYIRPVVASDQLKGEPERLCLDVQRRHLYVTQNQHRDGKDTAGRVVVITL